MKHKILFAVMAFAYLLPFWTAAQEEAAYSLIVNNTFIPKYGYVDKDGTFVIDFKYIDAQEFSEGLAAVLYGGKWGFSDKNETFVIPNKYTNAESFHEGISRVHFIVDTRRKGGYIDKIANEIIPHKSAEAGLFSEGLARVNGNKKWAVIDK